MKQNMKTFNWNL